MKKKKFPFFYLFAFLLILMSLPKETAEKLQGTTVAFLAPAWEQVNQVVHLLRKLTQGNRSQISGATVEDIQRLQLDNQLLSNEIDRLKNILLGELDLHENSESFPEEEVQLHREDLRHVINRQLHALPAEVIFRSPSSWDHSLWINVGKTLNEVLGKEMIAKNSPVFVGTSVVGVIDYVGRKQSRVRLLTDSGLTPSVRAVREYEGKMWYLAKGELQGSTHRYFLKGTGFNYDFDDVEGPARDLRTGVPIGNSTDCPTLPILQKDDVLVTTGMDGVFPPGFQVATVHSIDVLKEGDYYYELEAVPTVGNFDHLSLVFVLPPVGYDPSDQPPPIRDWY